MENTATPASARAPGTDRAHAVLIPAEPSAREHGLACQLERALGMLKDLAAGYPWRELGIRMDQVLREAEQIGVVLDESLKQRRPRPRHPFRPSGQTLIKHVLLYTEPDHPFDLLVYRCAADDMAHAEEQCEGAYPGCTIVWGESFAAGDANAAMPDADIEETMDRYGRSAGP